MFRKTMVSQLSGTVLNKSCLGGYRWLHRGKTNGMVRRKGVLASPKLSEAQCSSVLSFQTQHYSWIIGHQSDTDFSEGPRSHRQDINSATNAPLGICPGERSPDFTVKMLHCYGDLAEMCLLEKPAWLLPTWAEEGSHAGLHLVQCLVHMRNSGSVDYTEQHQELPQRQKDYRTQARVWV